MVENVPEAVGAVRAAVAVEVGLAVLGPVVPVEDGVRLPADESQGVRFPTKELPVIRFCPQPAKRKIAVSDDATMFPRKTLR